MAQYSYNPKDYPLGPAPRISILWRTDGAAEIVDTDAGRVLRLSVSAAGRHGFAVQDKHGSDIVAGDMEVFTEDVDVTGWIGVRTSCRLGGAAGSEDGYHAGTETNFERPGGLYAYINGDFLVLLRADTVTASMPMTSRLKAVGSSLSGEVTWNNGADQGSRETTDTNLTSGHVGVILFDVGTRDISFIGIGTDGDPAPTQPLDDYQFLYDPYLFSIASIGGIPTLTFPGVIDITATSARPQVTLTY